MPFDMNNIPENIEQTTVKSFLAETGIHVHIDGEGYPAKLDEITQGSTLLPQGKRLVDLIKALESPEEGSVQAQHRTQLKEYLTQHRDEIVATSGITEMSPAELAAEQAGDLQTSFDSSLRQLYEDSGYTPGRGGQTTLDGAEELFGHAIETALGDTLTRLQNAPAGSEDAQAYDEIKTFFAENPPNLVEGALTYYVGGGGGNTAELFTKISQQMDSPTIAQAAFTMAGVDEIKAGNFVQRLRSEEGIQHRLDDLVASITGMENDGGAPDIEGLQNRISSQAPMLQAIADNPDSFFQIAETQSFERVVETVTDHLENNGTLDNQGVMDIVAGIPLRDKASMFMEIGGASQEQTSEFTTTLDRAQAINPDIERVINGAIGNSIAQADGGASGNVFERLTQGSALFAEYANHQLITDNLTNEHVLDRTIREYDEQMAASQNTDIAADERPHAPRLDDIGGFAAESAFLNEAGRAIAVNSSALGPMGLMMASGLVRNGADRARQLGDLDSANFMGLPIQAFANMLNGNAAGGFSSVLGNFLPGQFQGVMATIGARFGAEMSPSQTVMAGIKSNYIFDGSDGYQAVDYTKIAENHANGVWDNEGNVIPEGERGERGIGEQIADIAGVELPTNS